MPAWLKSRLACVCYGVTMQRNDYIRLEDYTVSNYLIDKTKLLFKLDEENTQVEAIFNVRKNPESKQDENDLVLNGENIQLDSLALDGKRLKESQYKITDSTLTIQDVPSAFKLKIKSHLNPKANQTQVGLYVTKGQLCTFCEPEGFRRLTYFLDRPDVQSTYETKLVADRKRYPTLISNGTLIAKGRLKNGRHWVTWRDPVKKPSYLFAAVAGQFDCYEDSYITSSGREIQLKIYVDKGKGNQCAYAMDHLKKAMRWDEDNYGRECELNEYKLIGVNDFEPAADENVGMNIFRQEYLAMTPATTSAQSMKWAAGTIAHEYFHHWSGNRVTVRDWFQISLKEGLTRFRDQSYSAAIGSPALERIRQAKHLREYLFDRERTPIRPDWYTSYQAFQKESTTVIYNKGAELYRMLQTVLGPALFRQCLEHYFDSNRGKAATYEDFFKAFAEIAKQDFSQYLLWIQQVGTPTLTVTDEYDPEKKTYTIRFSQAYDGDESENKAVPIPVKMALLDENGYALPLSMEDQSITEKVLLVKDEVAEFTFTNIPVKPTPSLLRDFSAPVVLKYPYTDQALQFLMKHDTNSFCRWDAAQQYIDRVVEQLKIDEIENKPLVLPKEFVTLIRQLLKNKTIAPGIIADLLRFDFLYIPAAHCRAKAFVQNELARQLKSTFMQVYNRCQSQEDSHSQVKELENVALSYLSKLKEPSVEKILQDKFTHSLGENLSDSLDALDMLINSESDYITNGLASFYEKYKNQPDVLAEWLNMLAKSNSPNTGKYLEKLLAKKWIDLNHSGQVDMLDWFVVNRARSYTAEGLAFLERLILDLDSIKPERAIKVVNIIDAWSGKESEDLVHQYFKQIATHAISDELKMAIYEKLGIEPVIDLTHKSNRQIHQILSKQGLFAVNSEKEQESSKQSCQLNSEDYKKYAEQLVMKSMK